MLPSMRRVLVIDDDKNLNETLKEVIERSDSERIQVDSVFFLKEGLRLASEQSYDIVFLDVAMPDGNSLEQLPFLKNLPHAPEIVIITGGIESDGARIAMKWGIWDYLEKPFRIEELILTMRRAFDYRKEKFESSRKEILKNDKIIGHSSILMETLRQVALVGHSDASVLISGETGTGKELFAHAIHENSQRKEGPYVVVDCASIPESLAESLLFGHRKGAFTGAEQTTEGLVPSANRGTLFLDEIGELPLSLQKVLLRVLQEKRFRPVGQKEENSSDFRLVAATNRNLPAMVEQGLFREDLFFRLKSHMIELPPLRERKEDLQELSHHFLKRIASRTSTVAATLTFEFLEYLKLYDWPGNVRELSQLMEKVVSIAGPGHKLFPIYLPPEIRYHAARILAERRKEVNIPGPKNMIEDSTFPIYREFREQTLIEAERHYFRDLLDIAEGNISNACKISGLSRARLYQQLRKVGLTGKSKEP